MYMYSAIHTDVPEGNVMYIVFTIHYEVKGHVKYMYIAIHSDVVYSVITPFSPVCEVQCW